MRELITQGFVRWENLGELPCPIRLTFNDEGVNIKTEWENVLDNGEKAWFRAIGDEIRVPLTRKAAFEAAKGDA